MPPSGMPIGNVQQGFPYLSYPNYASGASEGFASHLMAPQPPPIHSMIAGVTPGM